MAESLGTAVLDLDTNDRGLSSGLANAEKSTKASWAKVDRAGKKMTRALTLPIVAAGAASIKLATDFESSLSEMVGLAGVSQKQVDKWGNSILELAPKLGKAPEELSKALYFVASSGVPVSKAFNVMTIAAKASASGLGETETVADALTSAMNAYAGENLSAAAAADILTATVREGKGEATAIAPVLGNLLPLASQLGVGFEEVGGSIAQMTRLGMDASESATNLQAVMSGLLKPSVDGGKALDSVGLSAAGLRTELKDKGVVSVLQTLDKAFEGNTDQIARVFPNIRALRGMLALVGKAGGDTQGVFDRVADSTGALDHAFSEVSKTSGFTFKQNLTELQVAGIRAGRELMPIATKIASFIGDLAAAFGNLSPGMQRFVLIVLGVVAALGPMLRMIVLIAQAIPILSAAMAFLAANPVFLVLAAFVALVVLLVLLYRNSETFRNAVQALGNALKVALYAIGAAAMWFKNAVVTAFNAVLNWVRSNWRMIVALLGAPFLTVLAVATTLWGFRGAIVNGFNAVLNWVKGNWRTIAVIISGPFAPLVALATNAFGIRSALIGAFTAILSGVRGLMSNVVGAVRGAAGAVMGAARAVGVAIWNGIRAGAQALAALGGFLIGKVVSAIGSVLTTAYSMATGIGSAIANGIVAGIGGLASRLAGALGDAVGGAVDSVKSRFGIGSPSKVTAEVIGKPLVTGIAKGISEQAKPLKAILTKTVRDAIQSARDNNSKYAQTIISTLTAAIDKTIARKLSEADRATSAALLAADNSPEAMRAKAIDEQLSAEEDAKRVADLNAAVTSAETEKERQEALDALRQYGLEKERDQILAALQAKKDAITAEGETTRTAIQAEGDARKAALEQGIVDLTDALNRGTLAQADYTAQLNALIAAQAPEYTNLGNLLGSSAALGYIDAWNALMIQSGLLGVAGLGAPGADMGIVNPQTLANQEAAARAKKAKEAAAKKLKDSLNTQLATMRDKANDPKSPGGTTVTTGERQAIENLMKRIRGLARGGWVQGSLGKDNAGLYALSDGEGVFRARAMEGMQRFFERGGNGGGVKIEFNGPVIGAGNTRELGRELAKLVEPALDRRVSLSTTN